MSQLREAHHIRIDLIRIDSILYPTRGARLPSHRLDLVCISHMCISHDSPIAHPRGILPEAS